MEDRKRLVWFTTARMAVVTLFLVSAAILYFQGGETIQEYTFPGIGILVVATYLVSLLSLFLLLRTDRYRRFILYLQIVWDLGFVTLLVLLTGGIGSPYSFLYNLSIISVSVFLSRREAMYSAALCSILYGSIMDLHYFGRLESFGLSGFAAQQYQPGALLLTIFVTIVAFFVTALLTGYLAERLRASEIELRKKLIDYEELERLNSSIVSNLNSGLLTITGDGRIRVFNRCAEQLTGLTQAEAYDRPLVDVIPGFAPHMENIGSLSRMEIEHSTSDGDVMTLGFNSNSFTDMDGVPRGVIINFQDLTLVKKMEMELERADRLAVIGELSASIAHEIRNPLASISGSVQLISKAGRYDSRDQKLLDIVIRETERLNRLIRDFLSYARPMQPVRVPVPLKALVEEIIQLVATDPRFNLIALRNECPADMRIYVDRDQFRQVLWNLFVNSAEAIAGEGAINVRAENVPGAVNGNSRDMARIIVSDTGAGMDESELKHLFEPFRTTKPGGSGLGLAILYRIIESHGGSIHVSSTKGVGTEFIIMMKGM